jgi:hypothetical protein
MVGLSEDLPMNAVIVLVALLCSGPDGAEDSPRFTVKPTAVRVGDVVRIQFAVSRTTDVAVFIEDEAGKVVRHLVAGVLGPNAPAPLRAGLSQVVDWDGRADYGKPASPGPFRVRVALGLGAEYDRDVLNDNQSLSRICALAAAADGTLYMITRIGTSGPNWKGTRLVAFNRDGTYKKTISPPPAGLNREQWTTLGAMPITVDGKEVPIVLDLQSRRLTGWDFAGGWNNLGEVGPDLAVTPDGHAVMLQENASIALLNLDPAKQRVPVAGGRLLPGEATSSFQTNKRSFVGVSGDGRFAYVTGIAPRRAYTNEPSKIRPAVYRVKLPERTPAEVFFGDPDQAGNDAAHLGEEVHGLSTDGRGNLLIADRKNNRVLVVSEAERKLVSSIAVESPIKAVAHPKSGAVYVVRWTGRSGAELVKFVAGKATTTVKLTAHDGTPSWDLALDASAPTPLLWVTDNVWLVRVEDLGDRWSEPSRIGNDSMGDASFVNVAVDRYRDSPEIYVRKRFGRWLRFHEATGNVENLSMDFLTLFTSAGSCLEIGPDGNLYTPGWPQYLYRWNRDGKPLPWETPFQLPPEAKIPEQGKRHHGNSIYTRVAMMYMTHTYGIRPDGHHFIFEGAGRTAKALHEIAPSGKRIGDPIIWNVSDAVIGPKFDAQGNIYIADVVRPLNQLLPPEFGTLVKPPKVGDRVTGPAAEAIRMYSSILKFSPKGGAIEWPGVNGPDKRLMEPKPYAGDMRLDPSLKMVDMATCNSNFKFIPASVTGAQWAHFGLSHLEINQCNCENTRFDVDAFGRVWYPDQGRYRIGVLDTNGNVILHFGGYGNADTRDVAFTWLVGVGATDRYAYAGDSMNQRLLRAKLTYAAEEIVKVP